MAASEVLVVILAILLPPVAVFLRRGCGADIIINILLCLLGHIPGVLHALYIVFHDHERRKQGLATYSVPAPAPAPYGDNKIQQQQPYGQQAQPMYFDQPREMAPEHTPPTYAEQTQTRGEKHEYVQPVADKGLATKEI